MKRELTNGFLNGLKQPAEGRIEISDTKRAGLRLRVYTRRAVWMYEKRVRGGVKRKHTLGTFCTWSPSGQREPGTIGLAEARAIALEIEAEAARGIDRVALAKEDKSRKEAEAAALTTVQQALDTYKDLHLSALKTGDERYRQITQSLTNHLGKSVSDLTRADIQAAIDAKARTGRKPYANRIRAALIAFANWCFTRGYISEPIGSGVARATKERPRERVLSLHEVREVWKATYQMGNLWGPLFRLLIVTGQRRGEISNLRWSEFHEDSRTIVKPGSRTKNGKPHTTHLSDPALAEMKAMKERAKSKEFVFSFDGERPVANASHAKQRLDKLLPVEMEAWRIHDLRTSMATALAEAGQPEAIVDRILNHSASGSAPSAVARVYNQAELLPQRAVALDKWAELVTQESADVVAIGSKS